jgi:acetyl esterase/lipase
VVSTIITLALFDTSPYVISKKEFQDGYQTRTYCSNDTTSMLPSNDICTAYEGALTGTFEVGGWLNGLDTLHPMVKVFINWIDSSIPGFSSYFTEVTVVDEDQFNTMREYADYIYSVDPDRTSASTMANLKVIFEYFCVSWITWFGFQYQPELCALHNQSSFDIKKTDNGFYDNTGIPYTEILSPGSDSCMIHFHGGGLAYDTGIMPGYETGLKIMASSLQTNVFSVEFRNLWHHPSTSEVIPVSLDDVISDGIAATKYINATYGCTSMGLNGLSGGGRLAVYVAERLKKVDNIKIDWIWLDSPFLPDWTQDIDEDFLFKPSQYKYNGIFVTPISLKQSRLNNEYYKDVDTLYEDMQYICEIRMFIDQDGNDPLISDTWTFANAIAGFDCPRVVNPPPGSNENWEKYQQGKNIQMVATQPTGFHGSNTITFLPADNWYLPKMAMVKKFIEMALQYNLDLLTL